MTFDTSRRIRLGTTTRSWSAAACLLVLVQAGCTSALTASYLRDGLWERDEHASTAPDSPPGDDAPREAAAQDSEAVAAADPEADRERREAALEEAMARLSRLGTLDPGAEAALVATLQRTQPEDWPVVVDEFASSLTATAIKPVALATATRTGDAAGEPPAPREPAPAPATVVVTDAPDATDARSAAPADATTADPLPPSNEPETSTAEPAEPAAPPALAVRSACFASAVRGWGEVERFTSDRFRPGQEVIVYVELENLAANESPAGHTTCVDASLQLVDDADRTLHTWTFDPVAETSAGRRHDYFARYIVRIPDSVPAGGCRVEMAVTDTLAGSTAMTSLPLEIATAE